MGRTASATLPPVLQAELLSEGCLLLLRALLGRAPIQQPELLI